MSRGPKILVCVTRQKTCERLIKNGQKLAVKASGQLSVIHVAKIGVNFLGNPDEGEALDYLFQISKEAGADITVLRSDDVVDTIAEYADKNHISMIVLGESPNYQSDTNIIRQLEQRLPSVDIKVIPA